MVNYFQRCNFASCECTTSYIIMYNPVPSRSWFRYAKHPRYGINLSSNDFHFFPINEGLWGKHFFMWRGHRSVVKITFMMLTIKAYLVGSSQSTTVLNFLCLPSNENSTNYSANITVNVFWYSVRDPESKYHLYILTKHHHTKYNPRAQDPSEVTNLETHITNYEKSAEVWWVWCLRRQSF